ncbi:hypothetical protein HNW77_07280 [Komagataeibacter sp. AV436]|uniref:RiboL-PSP-HEPN domain-containing protein n=1 Tax=Komagataeibacter melomenusus TaxID=2766578 RepID=A0ABX2AD06_9PROT|nr:HEPN domain-containing protein [Komagataeibacter melomenusus]MBV1830801.1 hypothetical protein [Komagataeibacter melomenusus]NPC66192.1 hypothetical protein [Komagataeibacter melomenusus]
MPSDAHTHFTTSLNDVNHLLWFHENAGGGGQGRRSSEFQALNKSAIVLICAAWESYVETVIMECAKKSIESATGPDQMLRPLKKITQNHIRCGKVENTWQLVAGDGWRALTTSLVNSRVSGFNTPKPGPVKELFKEIIGIQDITNDWQWHHNPLGTPENRLKEFVQLRGAIAHGAILERTIRKVDVTSAKDLISRIVEIVDGRLVRENFI